MRCAKGVAELQSRPLPVWRGREYEYRLWIRGDSEKRKEFKVDLRLEGEPEARRRSTGGFVGGGNVLVADGWKCLANRFVMPAAESGAPEQTTAILRLRAETPGTYWVDDVRFGCVAAALPAGPAAEETLATPAGARRYALLAGTNAALFRCRADGADYVQGGASWRLENAAPTLPKETVVGVPKPDALKDAAFLTLRSEPFPLERGRTCTLAFWARTDAGQLQVWHAIQPPDAPLVPIADPSYPGRAWPFEQVVTVGNEWREYVLTFKVAARADAPCVHIVRFTDRAALWLDDVRVRVARED
jgi:hypothetical protein